MYLTDRVLLDRRTLGLGSALLLPGLLAVGCVSLAKPENVSKNCPTSSAVTCSKQLPTTGGDAKDDTLDNPNPDLPRGAEAPILKPGAGADVPPAVQDTAPGQTDSATVDQDIAGGDGRALSDGADTVSPPSDLAAEKASDAEPGAEPLAAEPGAEPSSGSEPGPESGAELGSEPGPEPPRDGGSDTPPPASNCTIVYGSTERGHVGSANTTGPFCVATCDDVAGWGCSNFAGRTVTVNGTVIPCTDGTQGSPVTKNKGYVVFQVSAGSNISATVYWWIGTGAYATSCPAPDGGVFP
jgi:hypothetical protein